MPYKRMRFKLSAIVLGIVIILTGCLNSTEKPVVKGESKQATIEDVREAIHLNRYHKALDEKELLKEFKKLLYNYESFEDELIDISEQGHQVKEIMTIEEALYDVDYFFSILKYGYAAYEYFGGDKSFIGAKEVIKKEINKREKVILINDFNRILSDNLNFINDGHFTIDINRLFKRYNYFSSEKYAFIKDSMGYYTEINGEKYYIKEVKNHAVEEILKLSLNEKGEIVYFIGNLYSEKKSVQNIDVLLQSKDNKIYETVNLAHQIPNNNYNGKIYSYSELDNIPKIEIRRMLPSTEDEVKQLASFVDDAKELRDKEIFIIDLRGNGGGYSIYPQDWFENYTNQRPMLDKVSSHLYTQTTIKAIKRSLNNIVDNDHKRNVQGHIEKIMQSKEFPGWSRSNYAPYATQYNPNLIFVITDGRIVSAGEDFVEMLGSMENVIFIGENTAGFSLVGNNTKYVLPYSGVKAQFGHTLSLNSQLKDIEGIGFKPDLWVAPDVALDRLLKFIEIYDVESLKLEK